MPTRLTMTLDLNNPIHKEIHGFFNAGPRKGVQSDLFVLLCQLYLNMDSDPNEECYRLMAELRKTMVNRTGAVSREIHSNTIATEKKSVPQVEKVIEHQERKGSLANLGM